MRAILLSDSACKTLRAMRLGHSERLGACGSQGSSHTGSAFFGLTCLARLQDTMGDVFICHVFQAATQDLV